jgi:Fe-S-cluster containining protein
VEGGEGSGPSGEAPVKCEACRGACCETMQLPFTLFKNLDSDAVSWVLLHGRVRVVQQAVELETPCKELKEGRCGIYGSPTRPLMCSLYPAGGADCLSAVRRRRTAEQYEQIRDPQDPKRIHQ